MFWALRSQEECKPQVISGNNKRRSRSRERSSYSTKQRLPDALLIGVSKCGSKSLMFFLDVQPQILPIMGEIEYLCDDDNYKKGLSFYYENLPKDVPNNQLIFEKDGTCWRRDDYAERVYRTYKSLNKTLKIVIVACDPVYRVQSWYIHGASNVNKYSLNGRYDVGFDEIVFNPDGSVNTHFDGIHAAEYDQRLTPWLKYFDRRQIHVIDGDLLKKDPYHVIRDLEEFLGMDHLVTRANFYFNETRGYFCKIKDLRSGVVRCMKATKGRYHPTIDPELLRKLYAHFKHHNLQFEDLTGQKFIWNRYQPF